MPDTSHRRLEADIKHEIPGFDWKLLERRHGLPKTVPYVIDEDVNTVKGRLGLREGRLDLSRLQEVHFAGHDPGAGPANLGCEPIQRVDVAIHEA